VLLREIPWDLRKEVDVDRATEIFKSMDLLWSEDLNPLVPQTALFLTMAVSLRLNATSSPAVYLRGAVTVEGPVLRWQVVDADMERIRAAIGEVASFVTIDIDCNQFTGADRRPVSSSTAALLGSDGPFAPGGLMRLMMLIAPTGAPGGIMRRPFANSLAAVSIPGLDLTGLVR
jgi:hypothetical protein